MENEFNIYHTETQEDYDDLMIKLNKKGYTWANGDKLTSKNYWTEHTDETVIYVDSWEEGEMTRGYFLEAKSLHPTTPIIKHKAKGVERMEKVVVPQYVADWYKECEAESLYSTLSYFLNGIKSTEELEKWAETCEGESAYPKVNAEKKIAKMHLYGYEVEKEKKYYWRKKKEYVFDFEKHLDFFLNYDDSDGSVLFSVNKFEGGYITTKFTEVEVVNLVGEEDFNKLEKVEIADNER